MFIIFFFIDIQYIAIPEDSNIHVLNIQYQCIHLITIRFAGHLKYPGSMQEHQWNANS